MFFIRKAIVGQCFRWVLQNCSLIETWTPWCYCFLCKPKISFFISLNSLESCCLNMHFKQEQWYYYQFSGHFTQSTLFFVFDTSLWYAGSRWWAAQNMNFLKLQKIFSHSFIKDSLVNELEFGLLFSSSTATSIFLTVLYPAWQIVTPISPTWQHFPSPVPFRKISGFFEMVIYKCVDDHNMLSLYPRDLVIQKTREQWSNYKNEPSAKCYVNSFPQIKSLKGEAEVNTGMKKINFILYTNNIKIIYL